MWLKLLVCCLIGCLVTLLPSITHAQDQNEKLLAAARLGDAGQLEQLLDQGGQIDCQDVWGKQPIILAASRGDIAAVQLLLRRGADINAQDNWHRTPLIAAAQAGRTWVVDILIHHNAAVNHQSSNGISALMAAAQRGNTAAANLLIAAGAIVDQQDAKGWTALMWAAGRGDTELISLLLAAGANINKVDCAGKTVLDQSKEYGYSHEVAELLTSRCALTGHIQQDPACGRAGLGTAPPSDKLYFPVITGSAARGPANAAVTIVEYTDFQCPYCREGAEALNAVLTKYGRQVRLILKHYPLEFHQTALPAALYFEAIARLDTTKAWLFQQRIFQNQRRLKEGEPFLRQTASELGVSLQSLDAALSSPEGKVRIAADIREADGFGIDGVPAFIINGKLIDGAATLEEFSQLIDEALSKPQVYITRPRGDGLQ